MQKLQEKLKNTPRNASLVPCSVSSGLNKELIGQFIQGMKAQLVIYEGKGEIKTSMTHQGATINLSLTQATKADVAVIEEWLLALIK